MSAYTPPRSFARLSDAVPFPYAGSLAWHDDALWRVHSLNRDDTATIYRDDVPSARGRRTVPLADLTDPAGEIARREDAPLAVRLSLALKAEDSVLFTAAITKAILLNAEYGLGFMVTPSRVRAILLALGWHRAPGPGLQVYLRGAATLNASEDLAA